MSYDYSNRFRYCPLIDYETGLYYDKLADYLKKVKNDKSSEDSIKYNTCIPESDKKVDNNKKKSK